MGSDQAEIILFHTTFAATVKIRSDTKNIKHILTTKKIQYEDVDLSEQPYRRRDMLAGSDDSFALPQLHVNGRFIGTVDDIQEFEDFGELDQILQGVSPADVLAADALAAEAAALALIAAEEASESEEEEEAEEEELQEGDEEQEGEAELVAVAAAAVGGAAAAAFSAAAVAAAVGGEAVPAADDAFETASEGELQEVLVAVTPGAPNGLQQGDHQQLAVSFEPREFSLVFTPSGAKPEEEEQLSLVLEPQEFFVAFTEAENGEKVTLSLEPQYVAVSLIKAADASPRRLSVAFEPRDLALVLSPVAAAADEPVVAFLFSVTAGGNVAVEIKEAAGADVEAPPPQQQEEEVAVELKAAPAGDLREVLVLIKPRKAAELVAPEGGSLPAQEEAEQPPEVAVVISPAAKEDSREVQVYIQTVAAAAVEQAHLQESGTAAEVAEKATPKRRPGSGAELAAAALEKALSGLADTPERELSRYYTAVEEVLPDHPEREVAVEANGEASETVRQLHWAPQWPEDTPAATAGSNAAAAASSSL